MARNVWHGVRFSQTGAVGARPDGTIRLSPGDTKARCEPYCRGHRSPGIPQAPTRQAELRTTCARCHPFQRSHAGRCALNRVRNMYRGIDMVWRFWNPLAMSSGPNGSVTTTTLTTRPGRVAMKSGLYCTRADTAGWDHRVIVRVSCADEEERMIAARSGLPRSHAGATQSWMIPNVHSSFCSRCIVVVRV
jgi:hypothetical protein